MAGMPSTVGAAIDTFTGISFKYQLSTYQRANAQVYAHGRVDLCKILSLRLRLPKTNISGITFLRSDDHFSPRSLLCSKYPCLFSRRGRIILCGKAGRQLLSSSLRRISGLTHQIYLSTTVHASLVSLLAPQRCVVFRSFLTSLGMLGTLAPQTAVEL